LQRKRYQISQTTLGHRVLIGEKSVIRFENDLRELENTNLPFIMFSYCKKGGVAYEDIDFGSEWGIARTGGFDFTFG
jgi:DNA-binding XRE family transcriptional regulator